MNQRRIRRVSLGVVVLAAMAASVMAADVPIPYPDPIRQPRSDYLRNWYVFSDTLTDGILDPGDTRVNAMVNWWTPDSSGTQNNMWDSAGGGYSSAPMNFATDTDPTAENYWLPRSERSIHFYMTYSQLDNNPASQFDQWVPDDYGDFMAERHGDTNGWALGWVTSDLDPINGKGAKIGDIGADFFIHHGKYTDAEWNSNPQVTQSNGMSTLARDSLIGVFVTPKWNDVTMAYDAAANPEHLAYEGLTPAELATIANSMEVHERNPYGTGPNVYGAYIDSKTPQWVLDNLVDDKGNPYTYDDAVTNRSDLYYGESKGGVIGGLGGEDDYDPEINNWGDQQVIRMDFSQDTLTAVDEIVLYDFGFAPGTDQVNPLPIVFGVVDYGGSRRLWYDYNGSGTFDPSELMPDNRIYIAQVDMVPEPATLALLGLGGLVLIRRRFRTSA